MTRVTLLSTILALLLLHASLSPCGAVPHAAAAEAPATTSSPSAQPGLQLLQAMEDVITDLSDRVKPSVVNVFPAREPTGLRPPPRDPAPNSPGSGSGVIVDPEGIIITNNHVIGDGSVVEVRLSDKTRFIATILGRDQDTDLAILKVTAPHPLPSVELGDSSGVRVGQWVLAVGNPFGLDRTVTLGVVSGLGRENMNLSRYEDFIQTDASINPGNSGGPLFNLQGKVIGINTAIINFAQGIGFAIPSNMVKNVLRQILAHGKVVRGWLGVGIQPVTAELAAKFGVQEGEGVLVNEVFERDPASHAGIKPGDIIITVNGRTVDSPNMLSRIIAGIEPGAIVSIQVVRDAQRLSLQVPLTERKEGAVVASLPASPTETRLGINVQDVTEELAQKFKVKDPVGVLIASVEPGSIAMAEGLRPGDLIKEVNRVDITSVNEYSAAVAKARRGETILLRILRESRAFYVVLRVPDQ